MTVAAITVVGFFVWFVGLVPNIRFRAVAYTLPIPMTTMLLAGRVAVSADHVYGVVLLVLFFYVVACLARWPAVNRVGRSLIAGVLYVLVSAALIKLPDPQFWFAAAAYIVFWAFLHVMISKCLPDMANDAVDRSKVVSYGLRGQIWRAILIALSCVVVYLCAPLMGGFVVTFPFAGVLVATELEPADTFEFAENFRFTSIALLAFFCAIFAAQSHALSFGVTVLVGWGGFALTLVAFLGGRYILSGGTRIVLRRE
ncbi:hypothetical protein [Mycolicibacterium llatzerense]|jgi:hypothetical protein|uniref:hypothetical protein n=1 Tax=Mycolicibacterium llatzerense TaxID=280871 RepID=UPI0008DC64BB|nr:hypothetical protein [Mycolicibacterium llatzerense]MCT7367270.1 hypothetical protein [Mycolicibacterium llatzerense]MCT7373359.1 hypothetical protein [Mycolicibacterium llatzerense]